jgi:ketosteroid isomerase-like protein
MSRCRFEASPNDYLVDATIQPTDDGLETMKTIESTDEGETFGLSVFLRDGNEIYHILLFDLAPPLQWKGADVCRNNWAEWFTTFQGPVGYEITELSITSADDVSFCHSLNRIYGARTTGEQTDVWVRATVGLRKRDGAWTIAHEHYSVPFYMQPPYKASLDLKP